MLMVNGVKPLMQQRLTHASLKFIKKTFDLERDQARSDQLVTPPRIGQLLVVCNVIASVDLSRMDRATTHMVAMVCIEGFSSDLFQVGSRMPEDAARARTLVVVLVSN